MINVIEGTENDLQASNFDLQGGVNTHLELEDGDTVMDLFPDDVHIERPLEVNDILTLSNNGDDKISATVVEFYKDRTLMQIGVVHHSNKIILIQLNRRDWEDQFDNERNT